MVSLLLVITLCAAPVTPPSARVGYGEALERVDAAPDVAHPAAAVSFRREAPRPGFFTSNPQLTAQPGLRADNGQLGPEGQLTLQQSLNLNGLGAARVQVVEREVEHAKAELRVLRQERRLAVSVAWLTSRVAARGGVRAVSSRRRAWRLRARARHRERSDAAAWRARVRDVTRRRQRRAGGARAAVISLGAADTARCGQGTRIPRRSSRSWVQLRAPVPSGE
jgi:hypothetical protein